MEKKSIKEKKLKKHDNETADIYVVTADGHTEGWGSELYLVGVFDTKKEAEECAEKEKCFARVVHASLNKIYTMRKDKTWNEWSNQKYLGGYSK